MRPTRENSSRSLISSCIRRAPSTANSMYGRRARRAALVAALQHLGEARDLAQRLLEVVRGDVGELLELLVGALQLARLARSARARRRAARRPRRRSGRASRRRRGRARRSRAARTARARARSRPRRPRGRRAASRAMGSTTARRSASRGDQDREQDQDPAADDQAAHRVPPACRSSAADSRSAAERVLLAVDRRPHRVEPVACPARRAAARRRRRAAAIAGSA